MIYTKRQGPIPCLFVNLSTVSTGFAHRDLPLSKFALLLIIFDVHSPELQQLAVFDTDSGKLITAMQIPGDIDDLFYDSKHKRLYGSCGEGYLTVFDQVDPDSYTHTTDMPTAKGARTSMFSSEDGKIFLAVPHRGSQQAEIRVYSVG